ncbi:glycerophosphodiester phosphodiesterase [Enterococcus sp. HY326]|uniref:glycerophosphodiester phosphodiesterase n=1 Tax=Enterococcus sp. HY326 TaxID=2971265 RepID=UPI00223F597D|nr:glycerophosphodiester phosphodiesterase [Enterococcus sp. HY326]
MSLNSHAKKISRPETQKFQTSLFLNIFLFGILPLLALLLKISGNELSKAPIDGDIFWLIFNSLLVVFLLVLGLAVHYLILPTTEDSQLSLQTTKQHLLFSLSTLKNHFWSKFILLACYVFISLPILATGFFLTMLKTLPLSATLLDFISIQRVPVIGSFIVLYLVLLFLGFRFLFALPLMVTEQSSPKMALAKSWQLTSQRKKYIFAHVFFSLLRYFAILLIAFLVCLGIQKVSEIIWFENATITGRFLVTLLQYLFVLNWEFFLFSFFKWLVNALKENSTFRQPVSFSSVIFTAIITLVPFIGWNFYNFQNLPVAITNQQPTIISHRGVSNQNGLQNTLTALDKTILDKPDYVEIDVQMTKDRQFVVYHDFDLQSLAGITGSIPQYNLTDLVGLPLHEGQQKDQLASFSDYFAQARLLNQKLLIELKSEAADTQEMVQLFLAEYLSELKETGSLLQSLRLSIVTQLKQTAPELKIGYIMPFSISQLPSLPTDFIAIDYRTVSQSLIEGAHQLNQTVFVWTLNDQKAIQRLASYDVDGIITDNLPVTQQALNQNQLQYSKQLLSMSLGFS